MQGKVRRWGWGAEHPPCPDWWLGLCLCAVRTSERLLSGESPGSNSRAAFGRYWIRQVLQITVVTAHSAPGLWQCWKVLFCPWEISMVSCTHDDTETKLSKGCNFQNVAAALYNWNMIYCFWLACNLRQTLNCSLWSYEILSNLLKSNCNELENVIATLLSWFTVVAWCRPRVSAH